MGVRISVSMGESSTASTHSYEFDQERVLVGRGAAVDVRLPDAAVSHNHCVIQLRGGAYVVTDEDSTNGTCVNGMRLVSRRPKALKTGDILHVGPFRLVFASGVPVTVINSAERTAAIARLLVREALQAREAFPIEQPRLIVLNGPGEGSRYELPVGTRLVLGRGQECDIHLADRDASREHAAAEHTAEGPVLWDLGSTNGVFVDEKRVTERALKDGNEIRIGATILVFQDPSEQALAALENDEDQVDDGGMLPGMSSIEDSSASEAEPTSRLPVESPVARPARPSTLGVEALIYLLAAVVLLASVGGLVLLFG